MTGRNVAGGIIYITVSLFILYSLIAYDNTIPAPCVASLNANSTLFDEITAFSSNIVIQLLGLFSYILIAVMFARGVSFFYWKRSKFKYQKLWLSVLLILAPVLYNVISTYPIFKSVLSSNKFDCYAGGYIGYAFSKLIFIDVLKQTRVYGWQIVLIFVIILYALQYICCFNYLDIFKFCKKTNYKKTKKSLYKIYTYVKKISAKYILKIPFLKLLKTFNYKNKTAEKNFGRKYASISKATKQNINGVSNIDELEFNKPTHIDTFHSNSYEEFLSNTTDDNCTECEEKQFSSVYSSDNTLEDFQRCNYSEYDSNVLHSSEHKKTKHHSYMLPSVDLLNKCEIKQNYDNPQLFDELSNELLKAMEEFSIKGEILKVRPGPIITVFEFKPAPGIKTSRVISLSEDIARSMSAVSARISTIPGRNVLGIELSNKERQTVYLSELFSCSEFKTKNSGIQLTLGKDTNGNPVFADLTKMPHLLIAGTTGSGKSVSINDMILSILFKFKPNECKLIMIDPKMLELSVYDNIPHLLTPVVTNPQKAISALKWAVSEMEQRYRNMAKLGVRNIDGFNQKLNNAKENPELLIKKIQVGFDSQTGQPIFETQKLDFELMPYIVIFVDEMADLMLVAGKEVEIAIQRLAQMARAAGIHLIMATQRPSVDVITGTIKANFPTRISFQVSSKIDSRTILGEQGAEQLLGQGDMLYMSGMGRLMRVHAPFVQDMEIDRVVDFIKSQELPNYVDLLNISESDTVSSEQLTITHSDKNSRL